MITIGLIGGTGAGKSEVARLLAARGAALYDVDRLAQETYAPGGAGYEAVVRAFPEALTAGAIDRRGLGTIVFGDASAMRRLTDIVWPLTRARMAALKQEEQTKGTAVLVFDVAVLIEAGWRDLVDLVWFVRASEPVRRERLRRRGLDDPTIDRRFEAQGDRDALAAQASRIIENEGTLADLAQAIDEAWEATFPQRSV